MKKLRIGVIGLGMGKVHIKGYLTHPSAEVSAITDMDEKRLAEVGEEFGIAKRYLSAEEMLEKEQLDLVSICTPNKFHKPLALAAFKRGCHVLCEKPMALNAAEAEEMLEAAHKAQRRIMINFSYRFNEASQALKKQAGLIGDVYFGRTVWHRRRGMPGFGGWFGTKALSGGGPLIDLGVHRLDLALWLMGYPKPVWVLGATFNPIATAIAKAEGKTFDVEDLAAASIRFENGALLMVEASWASNQKKLEHMETALFGTLGGLSQHNVDEGYDAEAEIYLEREGCQFDMKLHPPVPKVESSYYHFVESIVTGNPHMATGEEGLTVMRILDAIYESARTGAPVQT
ncbi:MAG: Gfo/Idh/MocA family protein [Chthoniobacteraceae bacterium]